MSIACNLSMRTWRERRKSTPESMCTSPPSIANLVKAHDSALAISPTTTTPSTITGNHQPA